jgi:hypothetical protein
LSRFDCGLFPRVFIMHWPTSLPLLCSIILPFVTGSLALPKARSNKHYAIMDNDWYTAGFVPYLVALDGDVDVLALASGKITFTSLNCLRFS